MVGGGLNNEYLAKKTQNVLKCSKSLETSVKLNIANTVVIKTTFEISYIFEKSTNNLLNIAINRYVFANY